MSVRDLVKGSPVWSFAIYASDRPFSVDFDLDDPIKVFSSRRMRLFGSGPHTQADPFLLVDGPLLYIFYEQMHPGSVGKIACARTSDLKAFEECGIVLDEPHHLSWPFVFRADDNVYMLPESGSAGELSLYRFEALPAPLTKVRTVLSGSYADPVLFEHGGYWYLFATSDAGLELFLSPDLLTGEFKRHVQSPISIDPRYSRSGGNMLHMDGRMLRVAQDCSRSYGENLSLIEICRLTPNEYSEQVVAPSLLKRRAAWNREGGHHLSVASFRGQTVVATDGRHRDYWINKILGRLW